MADARPILKMIGIERLQPGRYQPRRNFNHAELQELADSIITTNGLLQPLIVRPLQNDHYEIIAGERRWRAGQMAGLTEISCLVKSYSDEQALQASIIENVNRAALNPIEEANAYQRMIDEFDYLHEEIAAAVGKSRSRITNILRLLKLENRVQELLISGALSEGHGKMLAALDADQQYGLAEAAIKYGWSVRKIEQEVKKVQAATEENSVYSDANLRALERALSEHMGTKVTVDYAARGGGSLKINFNNIDELEGHFDRLSFQYES